MKKIWLGIFLLFSMVLNAAVTMQIGTGSATLENEWLRVKFSNPGGKIISFYDKKGRTELTWYKDGSNSAGACKDQIPVMDFSFRDSDYTFESVRNSPDSCAFRVTSRNSKLLWKFQKIQREYTLNAGEKVLSCKLRIINQKENMAPVTIQYWMHSYFGVPGEENQFQFASTSGVQKFVPSEKTNGKMIVNHTRNWLGMIGKSGRGMIVMPEYYRLGIIYPWFCKSFSPLDTVEFRLIPESIPEDSAMETTILFAAAAHLPEISGAGPEGEGFVSIEKENIRGKISGFMTCSGKLVLLVDGKKSGEKKIDIKTGQVSEFVFTGLKLLKKNSFITVEFYRDGKKSFDLICGQGPVPSPEKMKSALNQEPWQYQFKDTNLLPYFSWTKTGRPNVLALVPLNGIQDIFELKHRRPMNPVIPVIFPTNYGMSWRISCTIPNVEDKTGCDQVQEFLKNRKYDTFLIGSGVFAPWDKHYDVWSSLPAAVRSRILDDVKRGAGLLIINPEKSSSDIEKILSGGREITNEISRKMDFSAAPFFTNVKIREAVHGKGKIILLDYAVQGWLVPRNGTRIHQFQRLSLKHRFQEYQFAILAQLMDRVNGKEQVIKTFSADRNTAEITLQKPDKIHFTVFDSYTELISTFTKKLPAGKSTVQIPDLFNGENYIHAIAESGDYAYAVTETERFPRIRRVTISKGKNGLKGSIKVSKLTSSVTAEYEICDIDGRLLKKGTGFEFNWDTANTVSNFHKITVVLRENGKAADRYIREFHLPEKMDSSSHFGNLLWNSGDGLPEYIYPEYWKIFRDFGFSFLYNGSPAEPSYAKMLRYSPLESGLNWLSNGPFHIREGMDLWEKTHDKKYLARKNCPSNPERFDSSKCGIAGTRLMEEFSTRKIFQLGDEMSISYYNSPFDNCICQHCMKKFRIWLKERHGTLKNLNAIWKTDFAKWEDVMPMTRIEILTHPVPAPWVEHRLFMDKVFLDAMLQCKRNIQAVYPEALVGPTGVNHPPHVYGGNWNFRNMSQLDCVSIYGPVRLTASFNRNKRLIMSYFGYTNPEGSVWYSVWESVFQGARSTNNWYGHVFVLPNMESAGVRTFYKDLMWLLRSGPGDLLYHSEKISDHVGILHSQNSLISNFLKTRKTDYWEKENSFAQAMEDMGIPYRFVAPDELEKTNFKVIILPEATALSDREIEFFIRFVEKGGTLIADYEPGTQTELCTPRSIRKMDELFGIKTRRFRLESANEEQNSVYGISIEKVGSGVTAIKGKPGAFVFVKNKKVPVLIKNQFGKGKTILLNFAHNYKEERGTPAGKAFLKKLETFFNIAKPAFAKTERHAVMHHFYRNGDTLYAALLPALPSGGNKMTVAQLKQKTFRAEMSFEKEGFLYEVIEGKYVGQGKQFSVMMSPGIPKLYAMMPYKPEAVVMAPAHAVQGDIVNIGIEIKNGKHHIFLMRVIDPTGNEVLCLRKLLETNNGKAVFKLPFALNDPAGTWKIIIKDGAAGTIYSGTLNLKKKSPASEKN